MNKLNKCNNCGKQGHLFYLCKLPIISYGIIVFRIKDTVVEYLMIRRKDSFGYIDFIRGKYSPYYIEQIQNSINEMSISEKNTLMTEPFSNLWKNMWGTSQINYKGEETSSFKKFELIKNGVIIDNKLITLNDLILNSLTTWKEQEWEFPKGRRNTQEKDIECAKREFEEETGYSSNNISIIENLLPFEEIFIGSNHKSYKHKYFLAFMNNNDNDILNNFQKSEVSKMEWKSYTDCLESIRPSNLEKKQLITNINKIILEYKFYS